MNNSKRRGGFTLIEVLIVVVIMAVLAATVIPQFSSSTEDAKASTLQFNLHTMRSQIELYKVHHGGTVPTTITDGALVQLTGKTNAAGTIDAAGAYGPYIVGDLPANPFNGSNKVATTATFPPTTETAGDVGWLYHSSGKIAPNTTGRFED